MLRVYRSALMALGCAVLLLAVTSCRKKEAIPEPVVQELTEQRPEMATARPNFPVVDDPGVADPEYLEKLKSLSSKRGEQIQALRDIEKRQAERLEVVATTSDAGKAIAEKRDALKKTVLDAETELASLDEQLREVAAKEDAEWAGLQKQAEAAAAARDAAQAEVQAAIRQRLMAGAVDPATQKIRPPRRPGSEAPSAKTVVGGPRQASPQAVRIKPEAVVEKAAEEEAQK